MWREMIEPVGWQGKFVGRWAGTVAGVSCGVGVRVGSTGDVQVVDEMLNSGVPEREWQPSDYMREVKLSTKVWSWIRTFE